MAQSGSALVWGTSGRRFESSHPDRHAVAANLTFFLSLESRGLNRAAGNLANIGGSMRPTNAQRSTCRILIADDESLIRLDLKEMLTHLGYDVVAEVGDGGAAIDLSRKLKPDLVIMDIKMPEVDGIAAAEILTREQIAPVVLLTAYSDQALVERARDAGVVGYVVKPFREAELLPVIELSLTRFAEFTALRKEVGDLRDALETRKVVERAKGVLMEVHGLPEGDAFRRIRKTSMDSRKSMKEVAEAILLTYEMDISTAPVEETTDGM